MVIVFHGPAWSNIILLVLMIPQIRRNGHFYLIHYWEFRSSNYQLYRAAMNAYRSVDVNVKTSHLFDYCPIYLFLRRLTRDFLVNIFNTNREDLDTSNFYHCLPLKIVENRESVLALPKDHFNPLAIKPQNFPPFSF